MISKVSQKADTDNLVIPTRDVVSHGANIPHIIDSAIPMNQKMIANPWKVFVLDMIIRNFDRCRIHVNR